MLAAVFGAVLAVAAGIVVVTVAVVAATSTGARTALLRGAQLLPGELSVADVDGTLLTGLVLADVHYDSESVTARFDSLRLEPALAELLEGRVVLEQLIVRDGTVRLTAPADGEQTPVASDGAFTIPGIPDYVALHAMRVENVAVEVAGVPIRVTHLAGSLKGPEVTVDALMLDAETFSLDAAMRAAVTEGAASGSITGNLVLPSEAAQAAADGRGAASDAASPSLAFDGRFDVAASGPAWRAAVEWDRLVWEGGEPGEIRSPGGTLVATPGDDAIDAELDARIEGQPLPGAATIDARAVYAGDTLEIERLRLEALGGTVAATGAVALETLAGHVSVDYSGIDPSLLDEGLDGVLRGTANIAVAASPTLRVAGVADIGGEIQGRPLDGRVRASYSDEQLEIARAALQLDNGSIELTGTLSPEQVDLDFSASLPRLSNWYQPVSGSVTAAGTIAGDTSDPTVEIDVDGNDLAWDALPVPAFEQLSMNVGGTLASHDVLLEASGPVGRLRFDLTQGYVENRLRGTLQDSVLAPEQIGDWQLVEPADYIYIVDGEQIELERACYAGPEDGRLCLDVQGESLVVDVQGLPNALAEPFLPEGLRLQGTTDAEIEVALAGPLQGEVSIRQQSLRIGVERQTTSGEARVQLQAPSRAAEPEESAAAAAAEPQGALADTELIQLLDLADVTLEASIGSDGLRAQIGGGPNALDAPVQGSLTLSPLSAEGQLDGEIVVDAQDLSVIGAFVDGLQDVGGEAEARIEVGGTPQRPVIRGELLATALRAEVVPLDIRITDGRLEADIDGLDDVAVNGELCSAGCVAVTGSIELPDDAGWSLRAQIDGQGFELADLADLRAVVSPRLLVQANPELATVTGTLSIPQGFVEVEDVPRSAIRPASETVVYGREAAEEDPGSPFPVHVDVEARLGDIRFEGLGLEAQLDGVVEVEYTLDGRVLVEGSASIEEGSFSAYGQTLTIEQGQLVFTGPPENPTLDIRATRVVEGSEVGLTIMGTARNPRTEVFAEQGLSESEAFARLFAGRSLEGAGETDPEQLERAAIGLGLRRALPTLGRIGESVGLDELGIEAPGAEEGAIVAGKQLGDDVYLRYKYGLFDQFSGLELLYRISERFRLRTETGTDQAIDFVYELERGGADPDEELGEELEEFDVATGEDAASPSDVVEQEFTPSIPEG
ncbi:MAG: translocation/assembly module TamB domain-containing protein [Gammaproteobacteria bacterium]|nr:translocation/assembly module TamB domain-containing protein [Gammaproteobacteria bacterium]